MAIGDELNKGKKAAEDLRDELVALIDAVSSIGDNIVKGLRDGKDEASDLSTTLRRGIINDTNQAVRNTKEFVKATLKAKDGALKQSEAQKLKNKLAETELNLEINKELLRRNGGDLQQQAIKDLEKQIELQKEYLTQLGITNNENQDTLDLTDLIEKGAAGFLDNIDKSGTLSKVLTGELTLAQKQLLLAQAAMAAIGFLALTASNNVNKIQKELGVAYKSALGIQASFGSIALESEKLFLTSTEIAKAFFELTKQTGLIADFGGQTLVTQATLTKQLGLSAEQAGNLSLLARLQNEDTEGVLKNTVSTVGALVKQSGVAVNVKNILEEISNISAAITVSLGKNPIALAEAAVQAKLFGANLSTVDNIASSLLDFESSIVAELEAELLIGKDINLEKARLLALNNDLAGLSAELAENEEIINAFATGNRIQQEAAAKALGLSREELAKIALQQDYNRLSAEQFADIYGDVTYQSLQSQSASEKFLSAVNKIKGIIGDIATIFAPVVDGFAYLVGAITQSKLGLIAISGILTGLIVRQAALATSSLIGAIGAIFKGQSLLGPAGIPAALGGIAAMFAAVSAAKNMVTADDMIMPSGYGDRILSTPKGSIALNNQDTVVAGTNLGGSDNREAKRTNALLEQILTKQGTVRIDSTRAGTAFSMGTYQVQ